MLEVGFAELKINYKRFASEVGDNAFDTLGAIALVEQTQTRKQNQIGGSMSILLDFKALLMQRFNRFIDEQVWRLPNRNECVVCISTMYSFPPARMSVPICTSLFVMISDFKNVFLRWIP